MNFLEDQGHRFHATVASSSDLDTYVYRLRAARAASTIIRTMRGRRMQSRELLLDEFAAALQFPLYFGRNWDAFEECMSDLQWLPANEYVLVIANAGSLLKMEPTNGFVVLFGILERVSEEWILGKLPDVNLGEQKPVPFHVLLQDDSSNIADLRRELLPVVGDIPVVSIEQG
jgi:RNAse (barnase) inhibitor barstar